MTKKRWPIWAGSAAVLALLLALGLWVLGPAPTWWNFQRLRVGMTLEEAEAIMGPPMENTEAAAVPIPAMHPNGLADYMKWRDEWLQQTSHVRVWHARERYVFYTHFDKAGRLSQKYHRDLWDD